MITKNIFVKNKQLSFEFRKSHLPTKSQQKFVQGRTKTIEVYPLNQKLFLFSND